MEIYGRPVEIRYRDHLRDRRGPVHGGALLPQRLILLDSALRRKSAERRRILVHELFHFVWVRLGNPVRVSWEALLRGELERGIAGELGWSAEWRREVLGRRDWVDRTRRWREYCCESFCDTASWLYAAVPEHDEYTLAKAARAGRRAWFAKAGLSQSVRI